MSLKSAYEKKLQAQLNEWSAQIDQLKAKADRAEAEVQIKFYEHIEQLKIQQAAAESKLAELRASGDDAWNDLKAGLDNAWDSLGQAVKSAVSRFK